MHIKKVESGSSTERKVVAELRIRKEDRRSAGGAGDEDVQRVANFWDPELVELPGGSPACGPPPLTPGFAALPLRLNLGAMHDSLPAPYAKRW